MDKDWLARLDQTKIDKYVAGGSWHNVILSDLARALAAMPASPLALIDGDQSFTFKDIWDRAIRLAAALKTRGLGCGDVVSFQLPNWHEAMVINLAATIGGFICNPIVPIYRDAEVSFILRDASSRILFIPHRFRSIDYLEMMERLRSDLPELREIVLVRSRHQEYENFDDMIAGSVDDIELVAPEPNDIKLLMYTSGTTGKPKGVLHTHNTIMSEAMAVSDFWKICETDRVFMPSPVTHITGYIYGLELPFVKGIAAVLMDKWDPHHAVKVIDKSGSTFTIGATPFLMDLARAAKDGGTLLDSLRLFACGGAPVAPDLMLEAAHVFKNCQVARVYGCTEAPSITAGTLRGDDPTLGATTDGRILNTEVIIVDPQGRPVGEGQEGEICVRGPETMIGYTDPSATAEAFDSDGFFHTGDLGFISHGCFITISGRKKDLIIRGGENISPKEIEDCLLKHPDVLDAAVVAAPHERLGEIPMAWLIVRERGAISAKEVLRHLDACGLARQKFPEIIEFVDEFPRTASGKVQKNVLRTRAFESAAREETVHE